MRVSKSILAQVEVARGSQRVSMGRFWEDVHHLFCAVWYFAILFVRKVLCIMVAASHCSCFSSRVGRGQGSAAGAAEDHMTCMLDAYKCMGANVFFVCFARETLGTKNAKCKRGCSFSFASETLGTKKRIEV